MEFNAENLIDFLKTCIDISDQSEKRRWKYLLWKQQFVTIMKTLDKYLILQFIKVFCGSLVFMLGLYLITISIDKLRYFTHPQIPSNLVINYILNIIPEIIIQVLPAAALFSTSYLFGNMNSSNEIIAIYNGKIGFYRLIAPLLLCGITLSFSSFFFFEFISADSSARAVEIWNSFRKITGGKSRSMYNNSKLFYKGDENLIYYIEVFDFENGIMQAPVIFKFDANQNMVFQLNATNGIYNKNNGTWTFNDAHIIHFNEKERYRDERKAVFPMKLKETPYNFINTPVNVMQMRMKDAIDFIKLKHKTGGDYKKYLVEFHWRFAFPFSAVIMIFIGSIGGIYFRKAVFVLSFFLAIIISFGYYGILAIGMAFGKSGKLDPIVAAWIANVIYLTGGIIALKQKK